MYQALIQPHFDYCNIVCRNCGTDFAKQTMHKLRNREARVFTYSNYYLAADHLFKLLGWKNLTSQQQFQRAMTVYKSLQELAPEYLGSKFGNRETAYNITD